MENLRNQHDTWAELTDNVSHNQSVEKSYLDPHLANVQAFIHRFPRRRDRDSRRSWTRKIKKKNDRAFLLHGGLSNVYYNGVSRIFLRYDTIKIVRFVFIHRDCTNRSIIRDFYRMFVHTASALQRMQIQRWIFDIHGHFTEYTKNDRSSKSWWERNRRKKIKELFYYRKKLIKSNRFERRKKKEKRHCTRVQRRGDEKARSHNRSGAR